MILSDRNKVFRLITSEITKHDSACQDAAFFKTQGSSKNLKACVSNPATQQLVAQKWLGLEGLKSLSASNKTPAAFDIPLDCIIGGTPHLNFEDKSPKPRVSVKGKHQGFSSGSCCTSAAPLCHTGRWIRVPLLVTSTPDLLSPCSVKKSRVVPFHLNASETQAGQARLEMQHTLE